MTQLEEVSLNGRVYRVARMLRRSNEGSPEVYQAFDSFGRARTISVVAYGTPAVAPEDLTLLSQRVAFATSLDPFSQFTRFEDAGVADLLPQGDLALVWVEDWVWGTSLETLLRRSEEGISVSIFERLALDLGTALSALRQTGAWHSSLSPHNIVLQEPDPLASKGSSSFKITELSSLRPFQSEQAQDDSLPTLKILVEAHNALVRQRSTSRRVDDFLECSQTLLLELARDVNDGRMLDGSVVGQRFAECVEPKVTQKNGRATLHHPFDFISAEHFTDDDLLVEIFAESCPWLNKVVEPNPNLIVGPRGCGKSTILRWLSIRPHIDRGDQHFKKYRLAAFFISCTGEIQSRVGHIQSLKDARRQRLELIHYFNLVVAREVAETLLEMSAATRTNVQDFGLTDDSLAAIHRFFVGQLGVLGAPLAGIHLIKQTVDVIDDQLRVAQAAVTSGVSLDATTGESFLNELSRVLTREVRFFQDNQIVFCLDDYSLHRVPEPVQQVLNRVVLGVRSATHIFKISAENYGFIGRDEYGAPLDTQRELVPIDCGDEFVRLSDGPGHKKAQQFARDLLSNRLKASGYKGTPEEILGHTELSNTELAKNLRARHEGSVGPGRTRYAGLECIADLCSGDVSTLLRIYRRIFDDGQVNSKSVSVVPDHIQHDAIRAVSRETLQTVKSHHPYGPRMFAITEEFGRLVRRTLESAPLIRAHGGKDQVEPRQYPRIEVSDASGLELLLTESGSEYLLRDLIRRSVFIELEPGNARRDVSLSRRLQVRRIFLPSFQASLGKNGAWKWNAPEFAAFLIDPARVASDKLSVLLRSQSVESSPALPFGEPQRESDS